MFERNNLPISYKEIQTLWSQGLGDEYCTHNPNDLNVLALKEKSFSQIIIGCILLIVAPGLISISLKIFDWFYNVLPPHEALSKFPSSGRGGPFELSLAIMFIVIAIYLFFKAVTAFYVGVKLYKRKFDDSINCFEISFSFKEDLLRDAFNWGYKFELVYRNGHSWIFDKNNKIRQ